MTELLDTVIQAHGGLDRWNQLDNVSARLIQGGALWALKGQAGVLDDVVVTASLHQERVSHRPFGAADRHSSFTPERVAIENGDGTVLEVLDQPRASFARTHAREPVEHPSARVLRRHGDVDLPDAAIHVRNARFPDQRAGAVG